MMKNCIQKLSAIFQAHQVDQTHGIYHALVVVGHGKKVVECSPELSEVVKDNIILACLLHDADDRKYFPTHTNYENARQILTDEKVNADRIEQIIGMIKVVSYSRNGDSIDQTKPQSWYYPRYSDRIDAIGIKGLVRAYQYAQVVGNPLYCNQTAKPTTLQQLQKVCQGRQEIYMKRGGKSISFIDHIYDKLLHLELPKYITNSYLNLHYEKGKQEIIDFVLRNAGNNFENAEKEIEGYAQKIKQHLL